MTYSFPIRLFCILTCNILWLPGNFVQHIIITKNNDSILCESFTVFNKNVKLKLYDDTNFSYRLVEKDSIKEIILRKKTGKTDNTEKEIKTPVEDTTGFVLVVHHDVGGIIDFRGKDFYNLFPYIPNESFKSARYIQMIDSSILLEINYVNGDRKIFPYAMESFLMDQNHISELYEKLPEDKHLTLTNPCKYVYLAISNINSDRIVKIKEGQRFYYKKKLNSNIAENMNLLIDHGFIGATLVKILNEDPPSIIVNTGGIEKEVVLSDIILIRKDQLTTIFNLTKDSGLRIEYKK